MSLRLVVLAGNARLNKILEGTKSIRGYVLFKRLCYPIAR